MEKMSLYKFTHILLLKNDAQLKLKKVINNQKKINHLNLLKNKNYVHKKKSHLNKQTKKKEKKKKEESKRNIYIWALDEKEAIQKKKE